MYLHLVKSTERVIEFKHTLDGAAREWYNITNATTVSWEEFKKNFNQKYSTQGRTMPELHERWRRFKFRKGVDDIEVFIRNVKETAEQLDYNDNAVCHMIKSSEPQEIQGTLYSFTTPILQEMCGMLMNLYATKLQTDNNEEVTAATPFSKLSIEEKGKANFQFMAIKEGSPTSLTLTPEIKVEVEEHPNGKREKVNLTTITNLDREESLENLRENSQLSQID